ncbi:MAG: hypothetical protein WCF85_06590 [Rhodospirillaceae bacterium]
MATPQHVTVCTIKATARSFKPLRRLSVDKRALRRTLCRLTGARPAEETEAMEFTDQMAAKMLAHAVRQLGQAVNEVLCVTPDREIVRAMIRDIRESLDEFEDAYFNK